MDLYLVATGVDGTRVSFTKLRCDEAAEMMGVWISPNENNKKLVRTVKADTVLWGGKVRLGHSTPE